MFYRLMESGAFNVASREFNVESCEFAAGTWVMPQPQDRMHTRGGQSPTGALGHAYRYRRSGDRSGLGAGRASHCRRPDPA